MASQSCPLPVRPQDRLLVRILTYWAETLQRNSEPDQSLLDSLDWSVIPVFPERHRSASPTRGIVGRLLSNADYPTEDLSWNKRNWNDGLWYARRDKWLRFEGSNTGTKPGGGTTQASSPKSSCSCGTGSGKSGKKPCKIIDATEPVVDTTELTFYHRGDESQFSPYRPISSLLPVHKGRPGQHLLRYHKSGQLYACIPKKPGSQPRPGPSGSGSSSSWTYQVPGPHRTNQCDHCQELPPRVLHAGALCAFHAIYAATGRLLNAAQTDAMDVLEWRYGGPLINSNRPLVLPIIEDVGIYVNKHADWTTPLLGKQQSLLVGSEPIICQCHYCRSRRLKHLGLPLAAVPTGCTGCPDRSPLKITVAESPMASCQMPLRVSPWGAIGQPVPADGHCR